jgi:chromatin segregation and condensation protein Rec8/ScpA/Scc1 (kleisin family)
MASSASSGGKPFYFRPPWNILFELNRLRNLRPWDVNIAFLLTTFLVEMEKCGDVDFRASGVALGSSSAIYLMKSKLLLELEKPPEPPRAQKDFLPPPLLLPVRYELPSTTVQELLTVLDEVLKGEHLLHLKPRLEPILPPPPEILPPLDLYLMEIEKQMDRLFNTLSRLATGGKYVLFSRVVSELERLEAVKTFIVLLFLAQKGDVSLWQDENQSEIYIVLAKGAAEAIVRPPVGVV